MIFLHYSNHKNDYQKYYHDYLKKFKRLFLRLVITKNYFYVLVIIKDYNIFGAIKKVSMIMIIVKDYNYFWCNYRV